MGYLDYIDGSIKSNIRPFSGSVIPKNIAISSINNGDDQLTASLLVNSAVIIFSTGASTTFTLPTSAAITSAVSSNGYSVTDGIIIDFVLVNTSDSLITLEPSDILDPTNLGTMILENNQAYSYKLISSVDPIAFEIYLISGGASGGGGGGNENIIITDNITAVGIGALNKNTTGCFNTAVGNSALFENTTGCFNTALGNQALQQNTTGCYNTAVGNEALYNNTTGCFNTALGNQALFENTTGCYNTAVGYSALATNETGEKNTAIGFQVSSTGNENTVIGYSASSSTFNECLVLGANALATDSNQFVVNAGVVSTGTPGIVNQWLVRINGNNYYIPLSDVIP